MKKIIILAAAVVLLGAGCQKLSWPAGGQKQTPSTGAPAVATGTATESGQVGLANPASVNCAKKGGQLEIVRRFDGGEYGVCYFEDNRQCEEWALFKGECPVGGVKVTGYVTEAAKFCAISGGHYQIKKDNFKNTDKENGTCLFRNGVKCDVWELSRGTCTENLYEKAESYKKAQELFDKALRTSATKLKADYRAEIVKLSPDSDLGYFSQAFILAAKKTPDYAGAAGLLSKALELNPSFIYAYANRGANYFLLGKYDQAISDASMVITLGPQLVVGYSNRAAAYQKKNMFSEALTDLNQAIELSPKSAELYYGRAQVYAALDKLEEAQADLKKFDEFNVLKVELEQVKK